MASQKPYKCMPLSGVFSKVLTQKFLYLLIGNSLRVGITNPCAEQHSPQGWSLLQTFVENHQTVGPDHNGNNQT